MEIKLYNRDLATPELVEDLTYQVERLRFSTKYHGGYNICSFRLKKDLPHAWEWITDKMFYRLVITDVTKTLWEGRVEDIGLSIGEVVVTAYGYFANLSDIPYYTAYNANADVIIKAVLTANCAQISADQTNIAATDIAIDSAAADSYLDIYPQAIVEKVLAFSDSTFGKWYFGIWEDRVPYLIKRDDSTVNWRVSLADFTKFNLKHRAGNLWNAAYTVYRIAGVLSRTADADDTTSQTHYGLERKKVIPDLGEVAAGSAQAARDAWVQDNKDIWPRLTDMVLGDTIYDTNGKAFPSSWLRAGEVLSVIDLVPSTSDLDTVARDALRTYYIIETEYDMDRAEMRITPDKESTRLDTLLAKLVRE